jgi:hypothetical protein
MQRLHAKEQEVAGAEVSGLPLAAGKQGLYLGGVVGEPARAVEVILLPVHSAVAAEPPPRPKVLSTSIAMSPPWLNHSQRVAGRVDADARAPQGLEGG